MFVFYDTETSGLEKGSQILQIALVFTDDDMNILSSKKLACRRSPWTVPTPGAMLITGFTPDDLKNAPLSNYEMMKEVDSWARAQHWPVTFVGYNSLGFDEERVSDNLRQCLLDPHLTTAKDAHNGQSNGRGDVAKLVKAAAIYAPGALTLKKKNDFGYPSMSLGNVAAQNGVHLSAEDAHDAMNDVKATIGVAQAVRHAAPRVWDEMMALSTVAGVDDFLQKNKLLTRSEMSSGRTRSVVQAPLWPVEQGGKHIMFNTAFDPAPYKKMTVDQLVKELTSKQWWEKRPFDVLDKASQPIMMPLDASEAVLPKDFDRNVREARAGELQQDATFMARLAQAAALAFPSKPEMPQGMRDKLETWQHDFHNSASWQDDADKVRSFYEDFKTELQGPHANDVRQVVKYAGRQVFEHDPSTLPQEKQDAMKRYIAGRALTPDMTVPWATVPKARAELSKIEKERAEGSKKWADVTDTQIRALKLYYTAIEKDLSPYYTPPAQGQFNNVANDNRADDAPAMRNRKNGPDPR
ncbi:MAG: exonuclease domain-containing protein [Alphaproteobacteria bacterium]|nr:exonuclease domain-containing protein [Alphaproteobacteria bacterium]